MGMKRTITICITAILIASSLWAQGAVEAPQSSSSVTFTDSRDKEITITDSVERIVSLSPNITEIVYALGKGDLLVGRTDYCNYPEEVMNIPSVGDLMSPGVESIVALQPDLVLVSTLGQLQIIEALEYAGVHVIYLNESQSMEGTYRLIESVGTILGAEEKAADIVGGMKEEIAGVQKKVASVQPPSAYYVAGFGEWGDFSATGDTFIHEIITLAGGDNIAADGSNWTYSLERLLFHDPEVIILPPTWGATFEETRDSFASNEAYSGLTAVKSSSIFPVDADVLNRQGPRSAHGVTLIAEILHPELFK